MRQHLRALVFGSAVSALSAALAVTAGVSAQAGLTVHEWGTFTSVAGQDGASVIWAPLNGPQDLPCFVTNESTGGKPNGYLTSVQVKGRDIFGMLKILPKPDAAAFKPFPPPKPALASLLPPPVMPARIRMETPVLYFYTPEEMTLNVRVAFEQGVMTEWFPKATTSRLDMVRPLSTTTGTIEWPSVRVLPQATPELPQTSSPSHYYAARAVDAAPVQVGDQFEKFLFYRGLADFQPPITATVTEKQVTASAPANTPMIVFENRGGRVGYRKLSASNGSIRVARPQLTGRLDTLRADLAAMLVSEGLYAREAAAMVETWRDSWFEEGVRIFYIIPKNVVDERLPLSISPAPSSVARVFVGRLELITPEMKDAVERALKTNDLDTLNLYGRFLDSIALQISDRPWMAEHAEDVAKALKALATPKAPAACQ